MTDSTSAQEQASDLPVPTSDPRPTAPRRFITFSRYITQLDGLERLLSTARLTKLRGYRSHYKGAGNPVVLGWGLRPAARQARRYAEGNGLSYLTLEDGFLRSVDLGVKGSPTHSVVMDDIGIHFDATRPSRLENLLNGIAVAPLPGDPADRDPVTLLEDEVFLQRARRCIDAIVAARLSKYNVSPEVDLPATDKPRVLVVDQTMGDFAIQYGLASADSFRRMLAAARAENPAAEILIKTHPDVLTGQKRAHFGPDDADGRTRLLTDDCNPVHLLQQVDKVYVVTSQLGFEALLAGKPVSCFGAPFYAGWGLTDDRCPVARRRHPRSLEQVFAAACLIYARYIDPDLGTPCEPERVIEHLALQRRLFHANAGDWYCVGFAPGQRRQVRAYLASPWNRIRFVRHPMDVPDGLDPATTRILLAGSPAPDGLERLKHCPLWCTAPGPLQAPWAAWLAPPPSLRIGPCSADVPAPRYLNDDTGQFTSAEMAEARLARQRTAARPVWSRRLLPPRLLRRAEAWIIGQARRMISVFDRLTGRG